MADNVTKWVGGIPDGWIAAPLKHVVRKLNRELEPDHSVLICSNKGTVVLRGENNPGLISMTESGYQGVEPEDLLIHGMDTWHGAIAVSELRGKCTSVVHVCDSEQDKYYLAYYLRCLAYRGVYKAFSNGVRQNTSDFRSWTKAGEIPVILPPLEKQHAIVRYLDRRVADIDAAIDSADKSITDYKKYKQALMYRAVTRGLTEERSFEVSEIPWIECRPSDWTVVPQKRLMYKTKKYVNTGKGNPFCRSLPMG